MKVISLINMKGGVGKTTLSTNICDCLSRRNNKKVLLIDIDPQFNATQCLFTGEEYIKHLTENKDTIVSVFEEKRNVVRSVEGLSKKKGKELKENNPIQAKDNSLTHTSVETYMTGELQSYSENTLECILAHFLQCSKNNLNPVREYLKTLHNGAKR